MPRLPTPHRLAVLVLPSVVPFDLGVACQVFRYSGPEFGRMHYLIEECSVAPGPVVSVSGFSINVRHGLAALRRAQTIVIPGIDDFTIPIPRAVCRALVAAHARGCRLLSICTGAFVLAEAGLLDDRRATTHWVHAALFTERYPAVDLDSRVLYIDEGNILTSAGLAAGIDLCLHVVRSDHGASVANAVARRMVVAPHRGGGQAQFVRHPIAGPDGKELDGTRSWAIANLGASLTVDAMAEHAEMPRRTFARRFVQETGAAPLQWLLRQRILAAQQLLEQSDQPVERIAARCGFGSAISLRVHFRRELQTSPLAYRRAFRRRD